MRAPRLRLIVVCLALVGLVVSTAGAAFRRHIARRDKRRDDSNMWAVRLVPTLRRFALCLALLGLVISTSASAGTTAKPRVITAINAWASTGNRVVLEGTIGPKNPPHFVLGEEGLWLQKFGSQKLKLIATPVSLPSGFCVNGDSWEMMYVAFGVKDTVGCLTVGGGISTSEVGVYVVLGNGAAKNLVNVGLDEGAENNSPGTESGLIPALFGDGHFLGFLEVAGNVLELYRITPGGKAEYVADLAGLSSCGDGSFTCGDARVDSGHIVIRKAGDSYLHVFTTAGKPVATFAVNVNPAWPSGSVAIRKNRIVVLTAKQLAVYTLQGTLVHSYPVSAFPGPISTFYGYAAYLGAGGKTVYVLRLSSGKTLEIARIPTASYGTVRTGALSLQSSGLAIGRVNHRGMLYVPMKTIRAKLG
ncbi:MAG: hypothetical protein ABSC36_04590 [Gaiellaceae bacterium]